MTLTANMKKEDNENKVFQEIITETFPNPAELHLNPKKFLSKHIIANLREQQ